MLVIPPSQYVLISDPAVYQDGVPVLDEFGQVKNRCGEHEVRTRETFPLPFALCPGEKVKKPVTRLEIVPKDSALRLKVVDFSFFLSFFLSFFSCFL